jgi:hypothetical protein
VDHKKYSQTHKTLVYLRNKIPVTDGEEMRSTIDGIWAEYFNGPIEEVKRKLKKKTVNVFCVGMVSSIVTCGSGHNVSYVPWHMFDLESPVSRMNCLKWNSAVDLQSFLFSRLL